MALTKIQRNMIADSAVMPNNIVSTASYTVGALRSTGEVTATNLVASGSVTAPTQVTTPKISVSGSSGLKVDTLRVNTGSWITYYDPTTKEITYGPITGTTGTLAVYDQSLNTTDSVKFNSVTATTTISVGTNLTVGTNVISGSSGFKVTGITASSQSYGLVYNPSTGSINYVTLPNQLVWTTSSVTFANLTVTNTATILDANVSRRLSANTATVTDIVLTRKLTNTNASGLIVEGMRSSTSSYIAFVNTLTNEVTYGLDTKGQTFNQNLNTTDSPTFAGATINGELDVSGGHVLASYVKTSVVHGPAPGSPTLFVPGSPYNVATDEAAAFNGFIRGTTATFDTLYVTTGTQFNYTGGIRGGSPGAGGDLYLFAGSAGYNGVIRFTASYLEPACSIIPRQYVNVDLGSPTKRWRAGYIKTLYVGTSTIYFEDDNNENTSTFSISSGTISLDGSTVLNQSVAVGASPTFNTVVASTSTVDHIEVSTNFVANSSTVQIYDYTMPTAAATTSGWAMTSNGSGAIEFQPAVLSTNITIDGGFANSVYTAFDYAIDGGGASA